MSVLEIVILCAIGLILAGFIFSLVWKKKHPKKKEEDEDGEES